MAPLSKKARIAARPVAGGGLQKFFGSSTSGSPAADAAVGDESSKSGAVPKAKEEAPAQVAAPVSSGLTDVQRQRIEENRQKALERQLAKKNGQAINKTTVTTPSAADKMETSPAKSPSPLKPQNLDMDKGLKRKDGNITPEKAPLPVERRHSNPAIQPSTTESDDKFCTFGKVPWKQYNSLYAVRLERLRGAALAQAQSLWSGQVPSCNFLPSISATADSSGDVVIVGVTFKDMPSRDNVIAQYRDPQWATSCLPEEDVDIQKSLCSDADTLWLEDGSCRLRLELPAEDVAKHATGFVVAVHGCRTPDGEAFMVKNICSVQASTALCTPQASSPENAMPSQYVALLSGLMIGAPDENIEARSRAVEFLLGRSEAGNQKAFSRAVQHVVVCGGVYWMDAEQQVPLGLTEADSMFSQIAERCPVHVLPGHKDPSNLSLPQMPLHSYFFKSSRHCSQFKSVSNPYQFSASGMQLLGHSGQPIRDLMRCSSIPTPIAALATCLDANLLVPTAPDTIATQPFDKADPFIIEGSPQVLFSGGHSEVEYEWREPVAAGSSGTLCVCVPSFHKRPSVVLVNVHNPRDIQVVEFGGEQS